MGQLNYLIAKDTPAWKRFNSGGFSIDKVDIEFSSFEKRYTVNGLITCACGRTEYFRFGLVDTNKEVCTTKDGKIDVAMVLEDAGINSVRHLQEDGFTEEQIKDIRKAYGNNSY